jgi:hypothetical protein
MSFNVLDSIIQYTGDYEMPALSQAEERARLCKQYGCSERLLWTQVSGRKTKVNVLLNRFILEKEVGECLLKQKKSSKLVAAKVTRTVDFQEKETYKVWFEDETSVCVIGEMTLELFKRTKGGDVVSRSQREGKAAFCDYFIRNYVGTSPGTVHIHDLKAPGNKEFRGIGSSFIQLAVEVSAVAGYEGRLCLDAAKNSHGFYRKVDLTAGGLDSVIDKELLKADEENREPNTSHLGVRPMSLDDESRQRYLQIISTRPISNIFGSEIARSKRAKVKMAGAGAKEENKNS